MEKPSIIRAADGDWSAEDFDITSGGEGTLAASDEARAAERFTLLIRAAKLVTTHGEFVGVLRDVSETGICVRLFHRAPSGGVIELHMPGGRVYELSPVWERGNEAGYEFAEPVDVAQMVNEASEFPKRGLRLGLFFPVKIRSLAGDYEAIVENFSQQGARIECEGLFAIDQSFRIESLDGGHELKDVRATIRWRRDNHYGVVFDKTLSLNDFACFAARLQCPVLLD